jgi:hypothetical protein
MADLSERLGLPRHEGISAGSGMGLLVVALEARDRAVVEAVTRWLANHNDPQASIGAGILRSELLAPPDAEGER